MSERSGSKPAFDSDAERAVLSSFILDSSSREKTPNLRATHFFFKENEIICSAIDEQIASGQKVDVVTLATTLRERGQLEAVGGTTYLYRLVNSTPAVANVDEHARIVIDCAEREKMNLELGRVVGEARSKPVEETRKELLAIVESGERKNEAVAASPSSIIASWKSEGRRVHEPTGLPSFDRLTDGGPIPGTLWIFGGAPDAGKTALEIQILHGYALRGIVVGLLAVDEEPSDIVTRLAQREGWTRAHCEIRDPLILANMAEKLADLPFRIYDASWTIEAAAADLARFANGRRIAFGIDSIQTAHCEADKRLLDSGREPSEVAAVGLRVKALRTVAKRYRAIVMATSEMGRSAYRSKRQDEQSSTLSSAKWSGAIEYAARVFIGLRSVAGESDLIEAEIAKNKHGPRDEKFFLRIDRASQTLSEGTYDAPPSSAERSRDSGLDLDAVKERVREYFRQNGEQHGKGPMIERLKLRKQTVIAALQELQTDGEIENVGTHYRPILRLAGVR